MRDKWTDERLDDLSSKVDHGFDRIDAEMRAMRVEMRDGFAAVNARIDSLGRMMLWFAGALIIAIVASGLGIVAAILTS